MLGDLFSEIYLLFSLMHNGKKTMSSRAPLSPSTCDCFIHSFVQEKLAASGC